MTLFIKVMRLMSCYWVVSLPAANHARLSIVPSKHSACMEALGLIKFISHKKG